ncbi:hypothetical protein AAFX24_28000 [Vibrio mediterranei]|uniref:hypothetical protein n=1 Tax=Vibrio mediterranei TaxID=689 RepID=UPI0038CE68F7
MRINVKSLSKYIATVFVSVVVTYTIIKMSDSNTEITATQPPVKPISPVAAVDEKSDVIPTAAEAATRNAQWDCETVFLQRR